MHLYGSASAEPFFVIQPGKVTEALHSKLMAENSDLAMTYAVKGMIPSNTIGAKALTRLHCYQGAEHAHAAQKPEKIEF